MGLGIKLPNQQETIEEVSSEPAASCPDSPKSVAHAHELDPSHLLIRWKNHSLDFFVARGDNDETWVWHEGRARVIQASSPNRQKVRSQRPGHDTITPPMPATVCRIMVEQGQVVKKGQPLVVLSAMKMETTLRAPHEGRVEAIKTRVGDNVKPGDILVDLTMLTAPT